MIIKQQKVKYNVQSSFCFIAVEIMGQKKIFFCLKFRIKHVDDYFILFCSGLQLRELWGDVHNQPGSLEVWNVEGWVNLHLHKSSLFLHNLFLFYLKIKKYLEKHSHLMLDATDQRFSNKTIFMHCIITNKREQKKMRDLHYNVQ
jgi:hypothetical protein